MWFKNQELNFMSIMLRYYMGEVKFKVNLDAEKTRLQAWFIDGFDDGHVYGAYYVYVNRLS